MIRGGRFFAVMFVTIVVVASMGGQLVMWLTLGLLFGALTERSLRTQR